MRPSVAKYEWTVVALLLITFLALEGFQLGRTEAPSVSLATIPLELDGWRGTDTPALDPAVENKLAATEYLGRIYSRQDHGSGHEQGLQLFIAYYSQQKSGEAMHSPKNCLPGSGWEIWKSDVVALITPEGRVAVNQYSIQNGLRRLAVLYWYQTRKRVVANEYASKLYLIWDAITERDEAGSLVRITVPDREDAVAAAQEFAARTIPVIKASLAGKNKAGGGLAPAAAQTLIPRDDKRINRSGSVGEHTL
jgi:EpsI family protein